MRAFALLGLAAFAALAFPVPPAGAAEPPVAAAVESSLASDGIHIRQFAFDGSSDSYFASAVKAAKTDHFTLVFERPVAVKSVAVVSGKPGGVDALDGGLLEGSADGKTFAPLARFQKDAVTPIAGGGKLLALRIRPADDLKHPLVLREVALVSEPAVAVFKYPVEIRTESEDPEMKDWLDKAARICEKQYPLICEELRSEGFKPRTTISMTLKNDYEGVAATGGRGRITGSAKFFKAHRDDIGAMVHETAHVVQAYRTGNNPGWLVEGIADYIRFYRYEKDPQRPPSPRRANYDGSYRITARFLNFVAEKYDKDLVRKLNAEMRKGEYKPEIWTALTKKSVEQLGEEWKESLK